MPTVAPSHLIIDCNDGALAALWAVTLIASVTCGLLIYSIVSFRSGPDHSAMAFVRRTTVEVIWAIIPILILISTAMPSVRSLLTENRCDFGVGATTELH